MAARLLAFRSADIDDDAAFPQFRDGCRNPASKLNRRLTSYAAVFLIEVVPELREQTLVGDRDLAVLGGAFHDQGPQHVALVGDPEQEALRRRVVGDADAIGLAPLELQP